MPRSDADRNLLFGILSLQMDFIPRDALIAAMNAWVLEKHRPIGEILVERGALSEKHRALLEPMVDAHVERHQGDPAASLAAISSASSLVEDLHRSIADPDVVESLGHIPSIDSQATPPYEDPGPPPMGSRYRKVRDHAKGGLGIVFIARDEELNREVALKEIQDRHADDPGSRARFLIEAEVTGGLEHPGIVPVYGLGSYDDGRPYYAMRFIKGDSLRHAITGFHNDPTLKDVPGARTLALQKLLRRFLDVCNAMSYAHSRGVLHRDLKPDNVMVGKYGETLVVDWGLAKAVGRSGADDSGLLPEATLLTPASSGSAETMPGSVIGTPGYMSPEQAVGRLDLLGPSSDVYSLGATLYCLLAGRGPFHGGGFQEVLQKVERGEFARPRDAVPWLDPALEAVCLKGMALRPLDRYPTPRALAEDIERWLADEPVQAYREPWTRRAGRWARKHRTSLATAGSAATVAALLLGAVAWVQIAQRDKTDASARSSLTQAEGLAIKARATLALADWDQAIAEAIRANDRIESGGGSPELRRELGDRLATLQAERASRQTVVDAEKRDRQVVKDLEEARLRGANLKDGGFDNEARNQFYLATFEGYGIDIGTLAVDDAAKRVRASKIGESLIEALDDWARYSANVPIARLTGIVQAAETDPVRASIRDSIAKGDSTRLRQLCERPEDREKLGPGLRGVFLALLRLDPASSLPLLEIIRGEHPADFWINHDLGMAYLELKPLRIHEAVRCLSVAVALRPESPGAHLNLGVALKKRGQLAEAIQAYREAIRLQPEYAGAHHNLAMARQAQGRVKEAIVSFREAIRLQPNFAETHSSYGIALQAVGRLDEAIASFHEAIRLQPDHASARTNLGLVLQAQGRLDEAIPFHREAIRLEPDFAKGHTNLGLALQNQGKINEAIESHRKAIALQRDLAEAHHNLGVCLRAQGHLEEAVQSYRKAIEIKPDFFEAHTGLGLALQSQGKRDEAADSHRKAIGIKPDDPMGYANLGIVLLDQGKLDEAVASLRKAIQLNPGFVKAYYNLGMALKAQGKRDEAADSYSKAIQIKPDYAEPMCNLGLLLGEMGRFSEALEWLERGHAIGLRCPRWPYPSGEWIKELRRFVELEGRLPAILKGETTSGDASERLELAVVCYRKGLHAASVRFADEAFAENPKLAEDLAQGFRYNAACSASLAGTGQGKDDPMPDEATRTKLREKALGWLRAELAAWAKMLDGGIEPARKQTVVQQLDQWKQDADLTGVREEAGLARLPEAEREGFRALWRDVEALRKKAAGGP